MKPDITLEGCAVVEDGERLTFWHWIGAALTVAMLAAIYSLVGTIDLMAAEAEYQEKRHRASIGAALASGFSQCPAHVDGTTPIVTLIVRAPRSGNPEVVSCYRIATQPYAVRPSVRMRAK